ncbi:hypothetical protein Bca52824_091266 [Brassica carinata]|uniref:Uncharacterized protein n=1 Tax=Brassica carinata TaxID=52824 RepID=A0A8X7NWG4_BRACI|nr:hypothetical protein Bca52824_091266 [Brassica carinata]
MHKETYLTGRESSREEPNESNHLPCCDETAPSSSSSSSLSLLSPVTPTDDELCDFSSDVDLTHLLRLDSSVKNRAPVQPSPALTHLPETPWRSSTGGARKLRAPLS